MSGAIDKTGERGSATIFACLALAGLLGLAGLLASAGAVIAARHQAQAGADLAALAVATALPEGDSPACAAGRALALRNGTALEQCTVSGWDASVTVSVTVTLGPFGNYRASAHARAGPADS